LPQSPPPAIGGNGGSPAKTADSPPVKDDGGSQGSGPVTNPGQEPDPIKPIVSRGVLSELQLGYPTANTGSAYKLSAVISSVANGFVYLTAPDERFYVTPERKLFRTVTQFPRV